MQASAIRVILFDIEGTLSLGGEPIAGATDAITQLRQQGYTLRFLTNTTTRPQAELLEQLRRVDAAAEDHELISAPAAARLELRAIAAHRDQPVRIWPLVADAIKDDFSEFMWNETQPDFIVLGDIGEQWNLNLINRLFNAMHKGAELIALHKNRFWQTADGLQADIGLFVAGLEYVTGQTARIMGKPTAAFFQRVLDSVGVTAAQTILVGDDLDSDVGGAQAMGIEGVLVKTGKFRQTYLDKSIIKPNGIIETVADFPQWLAAR